MNTEAAKNKACRVSHQAGDPRHLSIVLSIQAGLLRPVACWPVISHPQVHAEEELEGKGPGKYYLV